MLRFSALRDRFLADTSPGGNGATAAIARALDHIGWRWIHDPAPDDLAGHLVYLFEACVHDHRDVSLLVHAIAEVLRDAGPLLDGGLPPVEAYYDASEQLVQQYVNDQGHERSPAAFTLDDLH